MGILKPIIVTLLSLFLLAWLIPAVSYLNFTTLVIASIVLTILNEIVRPALKILFLPINIITLGIFSWVINVLILWLLIAIVPGFHIDQINAFGFHFGWFFSLLIVSFLISLIRSIIDLVF
jgi:putative membrane protein